MGCKAQCAVHSPAMDKRCNAADHPKRHLPEGLGRNRAISASHRLHGQEPMRRAETSNSSRLRPNAAPDRWAAAGSVDTDLSFLSFLELYRTDVAQRRMAPGRVVEPLDVIEDVSTSLLPGPVYLPSRSLCLQ